jgi:alkane 1-monooxygenase
MQTRWPMMPLPRSRRRERWQRRRAKQDCRMAETTEGQANGWVRRLLTSRAVNTVRYSLMNIFILCGMAAIAYGGNWCWTGLILSFALIGYVDELFGDAGPKEKMPPVWYMQLMLYLTLPLLVILTIVVFNTTSHTGGFAWVDTVFRFFGFDPAAARARTHDFASQGAYVSLGMFYGMAGVNVAHELVHRTDKPFDVLIGKWLLAFTWDTGFAIEHVFGHHRNVGTEKDPATARRGEYIIPFVARSTIGQVIGAYKTEQDRLQRRGIPDLPWNNRFWRGQAMTLCVVLFYCAFLGPSGILACLYSGLLGKIYLEIVNYIEHYGLVRIPGQPVEARHSWDSYRRVSSGMFYNLQLHAHHHRVATRRFWELTPSYGEAPVLPYGYMVSIFIAFVPGVWPKISAPLLRDWDDRLASPEERAYLKGKGIFLGTERADEERTAAQ